MEKIDSTIGKSIRHYRWLQGVPLADLAAALGISDAQLRSHEAGKSRISAARLIEVSRLLGVDVAVFFQRNAENAPPKTPPSDALQSGKYLATLMTHFQRLNDLQKRVIVDLVTSMAKEHPPAPPLPPRLPMIKAKSGAQMGRATTGAMPEGVKESEGGRDGPY